MVDTPDQWWWTPARRGSVCCECSEPVPTGAAVAYKHTDEYSLCEICVEAKGLVPIASKAWRKMARSIGKAQARRERKLRAARRPKNPVTVRILSPAALRDYERKVVR